MEDAPNFTEEEIKRKHQHLADVYFAGRQDGYMKCMQTVKPRLRAMMLNSLIMGFLFGLLAAVIVVIVHRGHV